MDLNIHHFKGDGENRIVGSHLNIPMMDEAFDFVNFSLSWHYTKFVPSKGEYERVRVLSEINRVLKIGGKAFINMIYSLQLKDMDAFRLVAEKVGFKVVAESTGTVTSGQNYESTLITLEKVQNSELDTKKLVDQFEAEEIRSLKFEKNDRKLKSSRSIIQEFTLNDKEISVDLTNEDKAVLAEERAILEAGHYLKEKHGSIARIPVSEITGHKFSRILIGKKYLLFKKLSNHNGSVIIK
jgi:SAM-dependent methyltransferase